MILLKVFVIYPFLISFLSGLIINVIKMIKKKKGEKKNTSQEKEKQSKAQSVTNESVALPENALEGELIEF